MKPWEVDKACFRGSKQNKGQISNLLVKGAIYVNLVAMQSGKSRCEPNEQTYRNDPNWLLQGGGRNHQPDKGLWVLMPPTTTPPSCQSEAINLSTQKGSGRGCKALKKDQTLGLGIMILAVLLLLKLFL